MASPTYQVTDPSTGEVLETFDHASDADVEAALELAHTAYLEWQARPIEERVAIVARAAEIFGERKDELAAIARREMGKSLEQGVDAVANAVKVTLGPRGRYVVLDKKFGAPTITNDGVTIAREIEVEDVFQNQGAQLVREVATATNDVAGNGTTTATVLAQAIVHEGLKNVAAGANPMGIKRGIEAAVEAVVEDLKKQSKEVSGKEDIARVATISARERAIGDVIADAIE